MNREYVAEQIGKKWPLLPADFMEPLLDLAATTFENHIHSLADPQNQSQHEGRIADATKAFFTRIVRATRPQASNEAPDIQRPAPEDDSEHDGGAA